MKSFFRLIVLLLPTLLGAENVDALLVSMASDEDLSAQTVKENDGNVIVFKRQDLDRMHIRSFAELIERIPFVRYNETSKLSPFVKTKSKFRIVSFIRPHLPAIVPV